MYGFRIGAKTVFVSLMAPAPLMMPLPMALKSPPTPNQGFRVTPKSPFESAFREVSGGADQVIEAGEKGVTVNIRRLRESRETQGKSQGCKAARVE